MVLKNAFTGQAGHKGSDAPRGDRENFRGTENPIETSGFAGVSAGLGGHVWTVLLFRSGPTISITGLFQRPARLEKVTG